MIHHRPSLLIRSLLIRLSPNLRTLGSIIVASSLLGAGPVSAHGPIALVLVNQGKGKRKRKPRKKKDRLTPQMAEEERQQAHQVADALVRNGELEAAGVAFDGAAAKRGDPVLFLDAGDTYLDQARRDRKPEPAEAAIERASIALDILYFQLDDASDADYRVIEGTEIPGLITRAEDLQTSARGAIEDIEAEREAAAATAVAAKEPEKKKRDPVKALTVGGAVMTSIGGVMLGVGAAGVGLGAVRQREAEDPTVYGEEYDAVAEKGERANLLAYIGLPVGAVFLGAGIAMLVVASKKKAGEPPASEATVRWAPQLGPQTAGFAVSGRF